MRVFYSRVNLVPQLRKSWLKAYWDCLIERTLLLLNQYKCRPWMGLSEVMSKTNIHKNVIFVSLLSFYILWVRYLKSCSLNRPVYSCTYTKCTLSALIFIMHQQLYKNIFCFKHFPFLSLFFFAVFKNSENWNKKRERVRKMA